MAETTASRKQSVGIEKKRLRNKSVHTLCKTRITKAEELILSGEMESAQKAVLAAIKALDKAAEKGILHANNTARRKSRLMKKLNEALAASSSGKEPAPAS